MYTKITNQKPKKRNKDETSSNEELRANYRLVWNEKKTNMFEKNPKRSKISCRASILNLTTTQRFWVYERMSESAQTNVLTRAHAYTAESYIYVQTEEFRLFSS